MVQIKGKSNQKHNIKFDLELDEFRISSQLDEKANILAIQLTNMTSNPKKDGGVRVK